MQPFWYFLRPPYVYPCWYNDCESAADWTTGGGHITVAVDGVNKKQGLYSVKFHKPYIPGGIDEGVYKAFTQCKNYIGFWVRANLPYVGSHIKTWINKLDGSYILMLFIRQDDGSCAYQFTISSVGHGSMGTSLFGYTNLDWLWVEYYIVDPSCQIWVNGVAKGGFTGWPIQPLYRWVVGGGIYAKEADMWLDWMRCFPTLEYPPTYPYL